MTSVDWHGPVVEIEGDTRGGFDLGPWPFICTACQCVMRFDSDDDDESTQWIAKHQHRPPTKHAAKTGPAADAAPNVARDDVITP